MVLDQPLLLGLQKISRAWLDQVKVHLFNCIQLRRARLLSRLAFPGQNGRQAICERIYFCQAYFYLLIQENTHTHTHTQTIRVAD